MNSPTSAGVGKVQSSIKPQSRRDRLTLRPLVDRIGEQVQNSNKLDLVLADETACEEGAEEREKFGGGEGDGGAHGEEEGGEERDEVLLGGSAGGLRREYGQYRSLGSRDQCDTYGEWLEIGALRCLASRPEQHVQLAVVERLVDGMREAGLASAGCAQRKYELDLGRGSTHSRSTR